jgi:uncharacterized membrane protein
VSSTDLDSNIQTRSDVNRPGIADLVWSLFICVLLLGIILLNEIIPSISVYLSPFRLVFGIATVLFIPGYLLQSAVFPRKEDHSFIERAGFAFGFSIALVPLLAILLNRLTWGLHFWPIVITYSILVVLLFILSVLLRYHLPPAQQSIAVHQVSLSQVWLGFEPLTRRLVIFAIVILLSIGLVSVYVFLVPSPAQYMTEFYLLGPGGLSENFPRQASLGQVLSVTIGITNHERAPTTYRLGLWQVDPLDEAHRQLVGHTDPINLQVGETRQWDQSWQPAWSGKDQKFEFVIYITGKTDPYRQLLLWMNID